MDKRKKVFASSAFALLFWCSISANAAIIDMGHFQYDESTGLEWLDLSLTKGLSINGALSIYSSSGWSLADESQFDTMYANYDSGPLDAAVHGFGGAIYDYRNFDSLGFESINIQSSHHFSQWYKQNAFIQDFGLTLNTEKNYDIFGHPVDYEKASIGFYKSSIADNYLSIGGVYMSVSENPSTWDHMNSYYNYPGYEHDFDVPIFADYGVFLVREASVPEPSLLTLMAAGLVGLGFVRRRKSQ